MVKTLEEMSAALVVAKICCKPKIKEKFLSIEFLPGFKIESVYDDFIKLNKILEQEFFDEIKSLPYPIRDSIPKHLIHFMGIEITRWIEYYYYDYMWDGFSLSYLLNILKSSHFTHEGTLDMVLVATEMIQDKCLDVVLRICIAIDFFLVEEIRALWGEMNEEEKKCLRQKCLKENHRAGKYFETILYFVIENNLNDENLFYVVRKALHFDRYIPFKNCWKLLNLSQKEIVSKQGINYCVSNFPFLNLVIFKHEIFSRNLILEFLRFFIYNVNEKLLKKLIIEHSREELLLILKYLLFWPYQDIFVKTLKFLWEKITYFDFYELLHSIVDMIEDDEISNTYNYRLILKEVWDIAPPDYRKNVCFMESEKNRPSKVTAKFSTFEREGLKYAHYYTWNIITLLTFLLSRLFSLKTFLNDDVHFVKQIASYTTASGKQEIVNLQGDDICKKALISGKLWLADFFLECFVEKELFSEFKQGFSTRWSKYISELLLSLGEKSLSDDITKWVSD